jgi:hypothetical protein
MSGICSTHVIDIKCIRNFGWDTKGKSHLKYTYVNGRIILNWKDYLESKAFYCGRN